MDREERKKEINEIIKKMSSSEYINTHMNNEFKKENLESGEYKVFKKKEIESNTIFEKMCFFSNKFLKLKAPASLKEKWDKDIFMSGMKVTSDQIYSALVLYTLLSFVIMLLFWVFGVFGPLSLIVVVLFVAYNIYVYPSFYSDIIRIKAGNETIMAIVYMSIYLSVNPVFLRAMYFAAKHLNGPIGKDFKKILWDLEVKSDLTIEKIIEIYTQKWILWNKEFINSLNLLKDIEAQSEKEDVYETISEAITNIEDATYNQMKTYAQDMRGPSSIIHSLGIVMPIIGMILFPMVSIFMSDQIKVSYIAFGYLVVLPFFLWWYIYKLIARRPGAFSHSRSSENLEPNRYLVIKDFYFPLGMSMFLLGFIIAIPAIFHFGNMLATYISLSQNPSTFASEWKTYSLNSYKSENILISYFMAMTGILGPGIALILYFYLRSNKQKEIEDYVKKIEDQFRVGLFELAKSLKKGYPIERSIPAVLENYQMIGMQNSEMYDFFKQVHERLTSSSVTIKEVLFGENGLMNNFPSKLIKDIMRILLSAMQKGTMAASNAAKNIVSYLKKINTIETLIKDILSEIVSSLKMQTRVIAPAISAIVATESVFLVQVLTAISKMLLKIEETFNIGNTIVGGATKSVGSTLGLIKLEEVVPPTVILLIVGLYLIEIVMIISIFINGIENGFDEINRDIIISKNLIFALIIMTVISTLMIIFFQPIISEVTDMTNLGI